MNLQTKRYTPTRKRSSIGRYIAVAVLALLLHATGADGVRLYAQPSDIFYIGDLNGDCWADTVRSKVYGGVDGSPSSELPSRIHWGIVPPGAQPCTGATVHSDGTPTGGAVSVPVTHIVYPSTWANLGGSASFLRYNKNDALPDMLLFLWGDAPAPEGASPPVGHASVEAPHRALVIFGQAGLDTLQVVYIDSIATPQQTSPVIALDLQVGQHLVEPQVRDYTGIESHRLVPVGELPREEHPAQGLPTTPNAALYQVNVYPNPAELMARLQSEPLEAGSYTIVVVAVNGKEERRHEVQLQSGGELQQELSLEGLPSGMYMVRLYKQGAMVSSQPIVVVH